MDDVLKRAKAWVSVGHGFQKPTVATGIISDLLSECERLETELEDREKSFALSWDADMRAIKKWQKITGKELVWPDKANLTVWLLSENKRLETERDQARIAAVNKCLEILGNGGWYNEELENTIRQHFGMEE